MSVYEGIRHLMHPRPLEDPTWNYVVLGLAALFESIVLGIAIHAFRAVKGDRSTWQEIRTSKDPTTFVVLFEDMAALLGIGLAFAGVYLGHRFEDPRFDGGASLVIGLLLMTVSVFLAYESKGLLIGEGASPETLKSIRTLAENDSAVEQVMNLLTMYFGPHTVLLTLEVRFTQGLSAEATASAVARLEARVRERHPDIKHIFVEVRSLTAALERKSSEA